MTGECRKAEAAMHNPDYWQSPGSLCSVKQVPAIIVIIVGGQQKGKERHSPAGTSRETQRRKTTQVALIPAIPAQSLVPIRCFLWSVSTAKRGVRLPKRRDMLGPRIKLHKEHSSATGYCKLALRGAS